MNILFKVIVMAVLMESKCAPNAKVRDWLDANLRSHVPLQLKHPVHYPCVKNIEEGRVVLINGFRLGATMVAINAVGRQGKPKFYHLDPRSGDFYTNAYRWALRAISMLPEWLGGGKGFTFAESQKVWKKRFYYMEHQVPGWLKSLLFYVDDWDREAPLQKRFNLYAKPSFDKHLHFPSTKPSENFTSFRQTQETVENLDDSEAETPAPRSLNWGKDIGAHYNFYGNQDDLYYNDAGD